MNKTGKVLFLLAFINTGVLSAPLERTTSSSRQFIVYGATTPLRGAMCELAEKTKKNLLQLLQRRDDWKTPILLNLQFPQANLPELPRFSRYFSQTGAGLKLQLDLTIGADVDAGAIQREVLRAILLEMMYRRQPNLPAGTSYVEPPEWLIEGVLASAPGQDRAPFVEALAPILGSEKKTSLNDFLHQKPALLDAPAKLVYQAYSLALVRLILDQGGGPARLGAYIDNLPRASNDPLADLKSQFPEVAKIENLDVLWQTHLATLGASREYELLTFAETERRLQELLNAEIPTEKSGKTIHFEELLKGKTSAAQKGELRQLSRSLMFLATSANPVLRPIIVKYQQIVELMAAGKRKGFSSRLADLKSTRARLSARMSDIDDYLNWFEATKLPNSSGAFSNYLKAVGRSHQPEPRRHDALSVYLDALEAQFQN